MQYKTLAYQRVTVITAPTTLTIPTDPTFKIREIILTAESVTGATNNALIRFTADGITDPDSNLGVPMYNGDTRSLESLADAQNLRMYCIEGTNQIVHVEYLGLDQ